MIGTVYQFSDLQELCRPGERPRRATVERWANANGVKYKYDGVGGIWTTEAALNAALGIGGESADFYYPSELI